MLSMYINVLTSDCARPEASMDLYLQAAHGLKSPEPVDQVRAKLLAQIEAVINRPGSGAIESDDIGSLVEDRCPDVPLLVEHIDTKNSDKEVTHGTRKPRARGKTQIG